MIFNPVENNNGQYLDYTGAALPMYVLLWAQYTLTVQEWEDPPSLTLQCWDYGNTHQQQKILSNLAPTGRCKSSRCKVTSIFSDFHGKKNAIPKNPISSVVFPSKFVMTFTSWIDSVDPMILPPSPTNNEMSHMTQLSGKPQLPTLLGSK